MKSAASTKTSKDFCTHLLTMTQAWDSPRAVVPWAHMLRQVQRLPAATQKLLLETVWMRCDTDGRPRQSSRDIAFIIDGEIVDANGNGTTFQHADLVRPLNYREFDNAEVLRKVHTLVSDYKLVSDWGQLSSPDGVETVSAISSRAAQAWRRLHDNDPMHTEPNLDTINGEVNVNAEHGDSQGPTMFALVAGGGHIQVGEEGFFGAPFVPFTPISPAMNVGILDGYDDLTWMLGRDGAKALGKQRLRKLSPAFKYLFIKRGSVASAYLAF